MEVPEDLCVSRQALCEVFRTEGTHQEAPDLRLKELRSARHWTQRNLLLRIAHHEEKHPELSCWRIGVLAVKELLPA